MNSVEAEGKTIDEAIAAALRLLNVERDQVEIEILSQASRGFLGIGGKKARVRATLRTPLDVSSVQLSLPPQSEIGEKAKKVLLELLGLMGMEARIALEGTPEEIVLRIDGEEGGLLIGRKGQTLDALEYLVNRMVSHGDEGEARIVLDMENYRERRKKNLEELALRLGERAKRRRKTVALNPLSPRDRRVIHLALQDDPLVTTKSIGVGYYRKLLIIPEGVPKREEAPKEERSRREERGGRRRRARG